MILSTIWYVIGALPVNGTESNKIQRVINNFVHGASSTEWNGPAARANMTSAWFYRSRRLGGWGLTPILHTLRIRKLSIIRNFLNDRARNVLKPWHAFITHMLEERMKDWCSSWSDITLWHIDDHHTSSNLGNWNALSPWWREAWKEWLNLKCRPRKHSIPRDILRKWPVWANRILKVNHGLQTTLFRSFTNTSTRAIMSSIRKLGFIRFDNFMNSNGSIMSTDQLYTAITVNSSVLNPDIEVPLWACRKLIKKIDALWANTTRQWLLLSCDSQPPRTVSWWHDSCGDTSFTSASNKTISKWILSADPPPPTLRLLKMQNTPITVCWTKEASCLAMLAPSRRDLMLRLVRNALPLGIKRIHWEADAQKMCMLCDLDCVESADHLFWRCQFAKETWAALLRPWRNHRNGTVSWAEVLKGYEVRLDGVSNKTVEQLWAIIRACVIRVIWSERNRRYFYASLPNRSPAFRHNQGIDDIKAHIESWRRRVADSAKTHLENALQSLAGKPSYHNIMTPHHLNGGHTA